MVYGKTISFQLMGEEEEGGVKGVEKFPLRIYDFFLMALN